MHSVNWLSVLTAAVAAWLFGGVYYTAVSRPLTAEARAIIETQRPDTLYTPVPRHLIPLPTPRRTAAQLRARLNHWYVIPRLETPSSADGDHRETVSQDGTKDQHRDP